MKVVVGLWRWAVANSKCRCIARVDRKKSLFVSKDNKSEVNRLAFARCAVFTFRMQQEGKAAKTMNSAPVFRSKTGAVNIMPAGANEVWLVVAKLKICVCYPK